MIHGQRSWANHPVRNFADLGDESPGKLRGTPFGDSLRPLAEFLALSSLPLHPSQLGPSLRDILKKDIIKRGRIVVPMIKDKLGNILEGKIPQEIADELGYKNIPTITLAGLSDQEKREVRVIFNLVWRQMTREQIRGLNGN